jgi:hypothetical protein
MNSEVPAKYWLGDSVSPAAPSLLGPSDYRLFEPLIKMSCGPSIQTGSGGQEINKDITPDKGHRVLPKRFY